MSKDNTTKVVIKMDPNRKMLLRYRILQRLLLLHWKLYAIVFPERGRIRQQQWDEHIERLAVSMEKFYAEHPEYERGD